MITPILSSANWTDTLKARNNRLNALMKIVDIKRARYRMFRH